MKPIYSALALSAACVLGSAACSDPGNAAMSSTPPATSSTTDALTDCAGNQVSDFTIVDSTISEAQTWSGAVFVRGNIVAAQNAAVTIKPGTQVIMSENSSLDFATNAGASLDAAGASDAPVQFCGAQARAGYWAGLMLGAGADLASRLDDVVISDAGQASGAALKLSGAAMLHAVTVAGSAGDGIDAVDFDPQSADVSVQGSAGIGLVLHAGSALSHFPAQITLSGNGDDRVRLRFDTVNENATLHPLAVAYDQEGSLKVGNGAALTMEAGVNYQMEPGASLDIGVDGDSATAQFMGTDAAAVTFSGSAQASGSWKGITIGEDASGSMLAHVEIRHAGGDAHAALDVEAKSTLDQVLVAESDTGVKIGPQGVTAESQGLTISGALQTPLHVAANALVALPQFTFEGTGDASILVDAGAISANGTIPAQGLPYDVQGNLEITQGASVSINAGAQFVMANASRFMVGMDDSAATIKAQGSESAKVVFRGATDSPGSWYGITIGSNVSADSSLNYVEIDDAGAGDMTAGSALTLETSISVTNSTFVDSSGFGILKAESDTSDYVAQNSFAGVSADVGVMATGTL
ncbi:MAG TPA: hypothetical protein VL137_06685, partial [Polyangiaceae bacterium]|nr:hypothetical protein [Polyangiaceae bacterium]